MVLTSLVVSENRPQTVVVAADVANYLARGSTHYRVLATYRQGDRYFSGVGPIGLPVGQVEPVLIDLCYSSQMHNAVFT